MIQIIGAVAVVAAILAVLMLVFRRRLLVKYAALWICLACVMLILFSFPNLLEGVAHVLGFEVTSNFLFFSAISLLLAISLYLSVAVTDSARRQQRLVEELALLAERVERQEKKGQREDRKD